LELERARRGAERDGMATRVRQLVGRIDEALGHVDQNGDALPAVDIMLSTEPAVGAGTSPSSLSSQTTPPRVHVTTVRQKRGTPSA
jgi:hypothetical protein